MTIDEAIEILQEGIDWAIDDKSAGYEKAAKLGIEALKRAKRNRHVRETDVFELLPGETGT